MIKSRRFRWARRVTCIKLERSSIWRTMVGKPGIKRPFCRPRCRWEYKGEGKSKFHSRTSQKAPEGE